MALLGSQACHILSLDFLLSSKSSGFFLSRASSFLLKLLNLSESGTVPTWPFLRSVKLISGVPRLIPTWFPLDLFSSSSHSSSLLPIQDPSASLNAWTLLLYCCQGHGLQPDWFLLKKICPFSSVIGIEGALLQSMNGCSQAYWR